MPTAFEAKEEYEARYNGQLTEEHPFGSDPLEEHEDLKARRLEDFLNRFQVKRLFQECVNGRSQLFKNSILFFIEKTHELTLTL